MQNSVENSGDNYFDSPSRADLVSPHPRVFVLREIMNTFDVEGLSFVLHEISRAEIRCLLNKMGACELDPNLLSICKTAVGYAKVYFSQNQLNGCQSAVNLAEHQIERPLVDCSGMCEILHRLKADIFSAMNAKCFLRVSADRSGFVDNKMLFGERVHVAFPSASGDIREAGNCLAAECNTAAVFHLMRASEFGLRAIAKDRNVSFANKPLSQQEWGTILGALDGAVRQMRLDDIKRWKQPEIKDSQVHFYSEIVQELRAFNEAWRKHVSHADSEAFYDRNAAFSVFDHVRAFMQKLSVKISETAVTPEYWTGE